jgi:heme exporter protein D
MMNWESLDAFWAMGGHGRFVWGAYGATLVLMLAEAWGVRRRLRRAMLLARQAAADGEDA